RGADQREDRATREGAQSTDLEPPEEEVRGHPAEDLQQQVLPEDAVGEDLDDREREQRGALHLPRQRHPDALVLVPQREVAVDEILGGQRAQRLAGVSVVAVDGGASLDWTHRGLTDRGPRAERVVRPDPEDVRAVRQQHQDDDQQQRQPLAATEAPQRGGDGHPSRASTKASGLNGARSSGPSPSPTSLTGTPSSCCTWTTMPPLAEPSSLVSTTPVMSTASLKTRAWTRPFCPVVASSTSSVSVTGACFSVTRLTLPSSSIRPCLFCRRPAVSMITVSRPWSTPSLAASKATLEGSAPSAPRTTSTPTRLPHVSSWSAAAARNVS